MWESGIQPQSACSLSAIHLEQPLHKVQFCLQYSGHGGVAVCMAPLILILPQYIILDLKAFLT